jgi:tetratricopeptide (TPR) repeat protein
MTGSNTRSVAITDNPFVGPRPFEPGERLWGRDDELNQLEYLLKSDRIVLLHSPSGAGKSSLVQAGLLPQLRGSFDIWGPTRLSQELPDGHQDLNRYVLSAVQGFEEAVPERLRRPLPVLAGQSLSEYLEQRPRRRSAPGNTLLIFDQFEEVLTVEPLAVSAKQDFFVQVGELLRNPRVWALFALREDYLAPLDPYARLVPTHLKNRFRIDLLDLVRARQAMVEPALAAGREFPAASQLVHDLSSMKVQQEDGSFVEQPGQYVEPVQLQVVCRRLWETMPADKCSIDTEDLQQFGDVSQALAGYYADSVARIAGGEPARERQVREWFGERLISAGDTRGQVLRGAEESEGLANELVAELLDTHLVRAEQRAGATWYELAHDRLIEPVQDNNRAWLQEHLSEVQRRAALWQREGRSPGLLLTGGELSAGKRWAARPDTKLTSVERRFLEESSLAETRRRRFRLLAVTSMVVAVLALVTGGIAWSMWTAAEQQRQQAEQAQESAEQVTRFLEELFEYTDPFGTADPGAARGTSITAKQLLDRGLGKVDTSFEDQPLIRARLMATLGFVYQNLGHFDEAEPLLRGALVIRRRSLGNQHLDVADSLDHLARLLEAKGDYDDAESLLTESLAMRRLLLGNQHLKIADSLNSLALLLQSQGDYDAAEPLFRESLTMRRRLLGGEHLDVADSLNNLALLLQLKGDYDTAEPLFRESLAMRRQLLGKQHPYVATSLQNLAYVLQLQHDYDGAEPLFRESLAMRRQLLGSEHLDVADSLSYLANLLQLQGDYDGVEQLHRESRAMYRRLLGNEHPLVAISSTNLAMFLFEVQGDYDGAEALLGEALAMHRRLLDRDHPYIAGTLDILARLLVARGRIAEGEALIRETLEIYRKSLPTGHERTIHAESLLASVLVERGQLAAGGPRIRKVLASYRRTLPQDHWRIADAEGVLASFLIARGRYQEAEELLVAAYPRVRDQRGAWSYLTQKLLERLIALYDTWEEPQKAAEYRALLAAARAGTARAQAE